jgi:signal transduction histidine kinase
LAAADDDQLTLHLETLDSAEVLESVAARSAARIAAAGRTISVHATRPPADSPHLLMIDADRSRLDLALTNLIDNALLHGDGAIEMVAEPEVNQVHVSVRDHGPGFPDGFREHAFERFRRGAAGPGGTGLGLAIVKAIVETHGGRIEARGADPGAVVSLTLPRRPMK